jgi:hypothetical protein
MSFLDWAGIIVILLVVRCAPDRISLISTVMLVVIAQNSEEMVQLAQGFAEKRAHARY